MIVFVIFSYLKQISSLLKRLLLFMILLFSDSELLVNRLGISLANEISIELAKIKINKEGNTTTMLKILIFLMLNTCVTKLN